MRTNFYLYANTDCPNNKVDIDNQKFIHWNKHTRVYVYIFGPAVFVIRDKAIQLK